MWLLTLTMPVGLVMVMLVVSIGLAVWYGGRKVLVGVLVVTLVGLYLMSTPAVGRWLTLNMMTLVPNTATYKPADADALVVLTAGSYWAGGKVGWLPRPEGVHRVASAYALRAEIFEQTGKKLPLVVSGGYAMGPKNPSEARTVMDFFARLDTDLSPTEVEEASVDTYTSATELAKLMQTRGWQRVVLMTGESHMARSLGSYQQVFAGTGLDVLGVPAKGLWGPFGWLGWVPSVKGLQVTTDAFYDGMGLVEYWWRGRVRL